MERPLQKIRNIQHSIALAQTKINIINRARSRDSHKIDKVIYRSIPRLQMKIKDSLFQQKKQRNYQSASRITMNKANHIKDKRFIQERQNAKSKEEIVREKILESQHIKELSKYNDQLIKKRKMENIQVNKLRRVKVREMEDKSKENIETFYHEKQEFIHKRKNIESFEADKKIEELVKKFKRLQKQEKRVKNTQSMKIQQFDKIKKSYLKLNKLKSKDLFQISFRLGNNGFSDQKVSFYEAEAVLNQLQKQSQTNSHDQQKRENDQIQC